MLCFPCLFTLREGEINRFASKSHSFFICCRFIGNDSRVSAFFVFSRIFHRYWGNPVDRFVGFGRGANLV